MAKTVMVIDDDENSVKFLIAVLEENGYETQAAYDGREGVDKLRESKADLLILDVMMPKRTGFVVFKQLKRDESLKDIPVLMLTGVAASLADMDSESDDTHARPFDSLREALRKTIKEMREEGEVRPEMFVDKPVDPDELIKKVKELIGD
ncbi:MAG: response regulator [Candidatus Latescibacterota bacterium]|nr:MAG: response regulator [Candidatus Latescibacterota bacterium]